MMPSNPKWRTILILAAAIAPVIACAQRPDRNALDDIPEIVVKAMRAAIGLKYSGERILEFREGPNRFRNREVVIKDGQNLRIEYVEGPSKGQIVVEKSGRRSHYFPDRNEIHTFPTRREEVVQRLVASIRMAKRGRGKVETGPGESIAGYRTEKVTVTTEQGSPITVIWIEPRSGMILKRELFDGGGTRIGYYEFTRLRINPRISPDDFELRVPGAKVLSPTELTLRLMKDSGFERMFLTESENLKLQGSRVHGDGKVLALYYQTPEGVISFMQSKQELDPGKLKRGGPVPHNVYTWTSGGRTYVLIGPHGQETLRQISQKAHEL